MKQINALIVLLLTTAFTFSQTKIRAIKQESSLSYTMKHALHEWTGVSKDVNCIMETDEKGSPQKVAVVVKVASFDSKNSNRDSHMLEVTDGLTHPNILFTSTNITSIGPKEYKVSGKLNFHGIERPVEFIMSEESKQHKRSFTGSFTILIEEFKIERPSLMFVKTDNDVLIKINVIF